METENATINQRSEAGALVITRIFDAPRELVWKSWTNPQQMMRWWGPKGFTCPVCKIDFRIGGEYLSCMRSPDGKEFWSKGTYQEIVPLEKLVMTDAFADEKGNTVPASVYGMGQDWPLELLVTVTLEAQGNKTKVTLIHTGIPSGEMKEMTKAGWNESLDKLAGSLS